MKRTLRLTLGLLLALLLVTLAGLTALLATERGLQLGLAMAQRVAPGELSWGSASGRLLSPLQFHELHYIDGDLRISIKRLELAWSPARLLGLRLVVDRLHADTIAIRLPVNEAKEPAPVEPGWRLPIEIEVHDLVVNDLGMVSGPAPPVELTALRIVADTGHDWIDFETFSLQRAQDGMTARGRLGLGRDVETDLQLTLEANLPGYAPLQAQGRLTGTWKSFTLLQELTAPVGATARLDLAEPFGALRWALDLDLPVTSLDSIHSGWPAWRVGGHLRGSGALDAAELIADLQTDWEAAELYPLHAELDLVKLDNGSLRLQPFLLEQGAARVQLSGDWQPEAEHFTLLLEGQALHWPLQGDALIAVPYTEVRVAGRLADYQLQVSGELAGRDLPAVHFTGQGRGHDQGLNLEQLSLALLKGEIDVNGQFDWSPHLQWDARLEARDIDPGQHWPEWPGRLGGRIDSQGTVLGDDLNLVARIGALNGTLRSYPVSGQGTVKVRDGYLDAQALELRSGSSRLQLAGQVSDAWEVQWSLDAPSLEEALPGISGRLQAQGGVSGARAEPRIKGQVRLADIASGDLRLAELALDADMSLAPGAPLKMQGRGQTLSLGTRRLDQVDLQLDGQLEAHRLRLEATGPGHVLRFAGAGGWDGTGWQGRLEHSSWQLPETGTWTQRAPAALRLAKAGSRAEELCWQQRDADLCLHLDSGDTEQNLRLVLQDWPLAERAPLLLPPQTRLVDAALSFELQAQRSQLPDRPLRAQLQLHTTSGTVYWQQTEGEESAGFGGLEANAQLTGEGLGSVATLHLTGNDHLQLTAQLPGYRPGAAPDRQPLNGQLSGEVRDLALLEGLLVNVDQLAGTLHAEMGLGGTLGAPHLAGELRLRDGRAFVGPTGTTLEDLQLVLSGDPSTGQVRLQGTGRSGPGTLTLRGELEGVGTPGLQGRLQISGTDFEVINLPEARVLLSPELQLDLQPQRLSLNGSLTIPEARIEPRDLQGTEAPSKDVVLLGQDEEPPPAWIVTSHVRMILGEQVHFSGFGLNGRLTGALDVVDEPGRVTQASGELRIVEGGYKAYGQNLEIEIGRLLYRGNPIDNPVLDVRAVRKTRDVLAGVKVSGDLKEPELELFSEPTLPQADQLSYLLLGRPVQGASGGEGQLLFNAASSLGLKGGNLLAQNIGNSFGLDEVSVDSGDDLDSAALVIGKYLSPRLYVNYSVGLLEAVNKLQIRYQLSERLSVQTETGTAAGADLLYSFER